MQSVTNMLCNLIMAHACTYVHGHDRAIATTIAIDASALVQYCSADWKLRAVEFAVQLPAHTVWLVCEL